MYRMPLKYFYWPGNIVRSNNIHFQGFWLVKDNRLVRCNSEGEILSQEQILLGTSNYLERKIPEFVDAWLWRDNNRGSNPLYDNYNARARYEYTSGMTDELRAKAYNLLKTFGRSNSDDPKTFGG